MKVANACCEGRVVSVLEGGYKIHGGIVSPFARSVASHVRGLVDGGSSREVYDKEEGDWESQFERHMHDDKEKRRQMKLERLSQEADVNIYRQSLLMGAGRHPDDVSHHEDDAHQGVAAAAAADGGIIAVAEEEPSRKRRRNQVDYKQLYEQMKKEGQEGI